MHPLYRRKGVAGLLLKASVDWARERDCSKYLFSAPRKPAIPAYESVGFDFHQRLSLLGQVGQDLEQNLDAYRDAPADSPKGRIAAAFGVRGDAGDIGRIRDHVQNSSDGYRALLSQFQGQTWSPGDVDETTRRLAFDEGMGAGAAGTFMAETLSHRSHVPADQVHRALEVAEGVEIAHTAVHLSHAMHGGAGAAAGVALPLVVAVGGFYLAREIHHAVEERREAFQQAAHTVGIR